MEMNRLEKFFVNSYLGNFFSRKLLYSRFFNFIGNELKGNALEIGCGIGMSTQLIVKKYPKLKVTSIDYDPEQIKLAKKRIIRNVTFRQGDGSKLDFNDSSFDFIIEGNTFHHIKNYQNAIKEAYRVIKKRGYFYVMDLSRLFFIWPIRLLFPPEALFTKDEFINELEKSGFNIEKSKGDYLFFIASRKL